MKDGGDPKTAAFVFELRRKCIHLVPLLIPLVSTFDILQKKELLYITGISTIVAFSLDLARMRQGVVSTVFLRMFGTFLRPDEKHSITSSSYYLLGIFLTILIFPRPIAEASMYILIIGDTMAAIVGKTWGRTRIRDKSLEGSLAFFIFSCIALALFGRVVPQVAILGTLVATVVELVPLPVNDNLTIPISSGVSMYLASTLF